MTRLIATDIHQENGVWYVSCLVTRELDAKAAVRAIQDALFAEPSLGWVPDPQHIARYGFDLRPQEKKEVLLCAYPHGKTGPTHKVWAIKRCRELTKCGLKEAKEY